jgi:hypothetical protein
MLTALQIGRFNMDQIIIGLFLSFLTRVIKNPAHAALFINELQHIYDGIGVILAVQQPKPPEPRP